MLRTEACSGSVHDLAHIPTPNCLADCLTKASAKADNLITAVQTRQLLDADIHTDFRTLMEHKAFLWTYVKHFCTQGRRMFSSQIPLESFLHKLARRTISSDVCRTQQQKKQTKLNTRECEGQDAAKMTSAPAESCIQFPDDLRGW